MIRFILRSRWVDMNLGFDKTDTFTIDGDLVELERRLRSGGRGPMGFDFCELVGVEVIEAAAAQEPKP